MCAHTWLCLMEINVGNDVQLLHVTLTLPRGRHPHLFALVLVDLAGAASVLLGLGKNSGACWFYGILLTSMLALTSPFMNCSSAPNKIMMLALRFDYRLCFLSKV